MINLRRAAAAPLAVAALALGALAAPASGASTATPNAAIVGAGSTVQKGSWCTYTSWGGSYYCGSQSWYGISGQLFQVFVIGTNNSVFTRWSNTSGVSGWVSLGGSCVKAASSTSANEVIGGGSPWVFSVMCKNRNNGAYYERVRSANGSWGAWKLVSGIIG